MPDPNQKCFVCPECLSPICVPIGEVKETYQCWYCNSVIHVHIWVDGKDPNPIDRRYIC